MIQFVPNGVSAQEWYSWLSRWEHAFDEINRNAAGPYTSVDVLVNPSTRQMMVAPRHRVPVNG